MTARNGDHLVRKAASTETVLYRDGDEVVEGQKRKTEDRSLVTKGTFGPILGVVLRDSLHGSLTWSHWEQGEGGPRAVFRYVVPAQQSHYQVAYCCLSNGDGTGVFQRLAAYLGRIAIDPATGAILRITVQADLEPKQPPRLALIRSDIMVEYGPIEIGKTTHILPLRSVSISRGRTMRITEEFSERLESYSRFETVLGDMTFGDYHMFRAESRMLPK